MRLHAQLILCAVLTLGLGVPTSFGADEDKQQQSLDFGETLIIAEWCATRHLSFNYDDVLIMLSEFEELASELRSDVRRDVIAKLDTQRKHVRVVTPDACNEQRRVVEKRFMITLHPPDGA